MTDQLLMKLEDAIIEQSIVEQLKVRRDKFSFQWLNPFEAS